MYTLAHTITRYHAHIHAISMHANINTHAHTYACMHVYKHVRTHMQLHTQSPWHMHTNTLTSQTHVDITNTLTYAHNKAGNRDARSGPNTQCHTMYECMKVWPQRTMSHNVTECQIHVTYIMSHTWMTHATHTSESCHTCVTKGLAAKGRRGLPFQPGQLSHLWLGGSNFRACVTWLLHICDTGLNQTRGMTPLTLWPDRHVCVCVRACVCTFLGVNVCVCMYVCVRACVSVRARVCVYTRRGRQYVCAETVLWQQRFQTITTGHIF